MAAMPSQARDRKNKGLPEFSAMSVPVLLAVASRPALIRRCQVPNRRPMSAAVLSGLCILGIVAADHAQAAFTTVNPRFIACSPKVLRPGQTLTLTLGPGHGAELAIGPMAGEESFFLVSRDGSSKTPAGVTMSPQPFEKARTATISTDIVAEYQTVRQKVFNKPGKYGVFVGDNLESDADPGYRCEFEFRR